MEEAPQDDKDLSVFERLCDQKDFRLVPIVDEDEDNPVFHYGEEVHITVLCIDTTDCPEMTIIFSVMNDSHPRINPGEYELVFDSRGNCWNLPGSMSKK